MYRPFASIVVACLFAGLFSLIAQADLPAPALPGWTIGELPEDTNSDAASIVRGAMDATFAPIAGNTLQTSTKNARWVRLNLDADWSSNEPPVLSVADAGFTHARLYAPPNYREQPRWMSMHDPASRFSRHAIAFQLPAHLRADQTLYLILDATLTAKRPRILVTDLATYHAADLHHVRLTTLFAGVELAMILVGLSLWLALRDRVFGYFVAYTTLQLAYGLLISGEFYDLPMGSWLGHLDQKAVWLFALSSSALSISFILEFCDLRRVTPRMGSVLAATRWPYVVVLLLLTLPLPMSSKDLIGATLGNVLVVSTAMVAFVAVAHAAFRGSRSSVFFLVAWMPQVAFTAFRAIQLLAGLPQPAWLEYGFPFTMAFASVVVVLGLADATLHARRERDVAKGLADHDGLTGLLNRRALVHRLVDEFVEARTRTHPLSLLFLDLDHFKAINDHHGHLAGDVCLKAVASAIESGSQDGEYAGRYGGEEFIVILPGVGREAARTIGERLRTRVEQLQVAFEEQTLRLTASIGVADMLVGDTSHEALIERADASLYRAKAEGRNRVGSCDAIAAASTT
ncbi:MAG: diguanylate cyclase [Dokdonella sp.]